MKNNLVSCIIPMFNAEKTIIDCLKSILEIKYAPIEILIINDGSTDKSVDLLKSFISYNKNLNFNFKIINNKTNKGISYSKNIGMKEMSGDFFFFAGADDLQFANRISTPLSYLIKNPKVDLVYSDCELWNEEGGKNSIRKRGFPEKMNNENSFLFQLKRSYFWSGILFARKSIAVDFDETISSAVDYDWYFNQFFRGTKIHFIRDSLAKYRLHKKNISKKLSKTRDNVVKILKKFDFNGIYNSLKENYDINDLNIAYAWYYFTIEDFDQSLFFLSKLNAKNFDRKYILATIHALNKDYYEAIDIYETLVNSLSTLPELKNNLAVCLLRLNKQNKRSIELIQQALSEKKGYIDASHNLKVIGKEDFKTSELKLTLKPLRAELTHTENYE